MKVIPKTIGQRIQASATAILWLMKKAMKVTISRFRDNRNIEHHHEKRKEKKRKIEPRYQLFFSLAKLISSNFSIM